MVDRPVTKQEVKDENLSVPIFYFTKSVPLTQEMWEDLKRDIESHGLSPLSRVSSK